MTQRLFVVILVVSLGHNGAGQEVKQDFQVDCIRPLGIRVTPSPEFRILQTGCRGPEINVLLEPPYDVIDECLIATATGTAAQVILEGATSSNNLVGGFSSRVFVVSCDFPGNKGYKDTFNRALQGVKQPAGLDPTATSGVFKYTGVLMSIIDKARYTARRWAEHLIGPALIGQELYLTISHPQKDEGQAYIIPKTCRVRPATGNFTTIWNDDSNQDRCLEVSGIAQEPMRLFTDTITATDVTSLQFFGFQVQTVIGYESEAITFECDVLLCGDVRSGTCGTAWDKLKNQGCMTTRLPRSGPLSPNGPPVRRRRRQIIYDSEAPTTTVAPTIATATTTTVSSTIFTTTTAKVSDSNNSTEKSEKNYFYDGIMQVRKDTVESSSPKGGREERIFSSRNRIGELRLAQEETVRVEIRMVMPRVKLSHVGSGSSVLPSTLVALGLISVVRMFQ